MHSHSWVRQAASRLLGVYFAARDASQLLVGESSSDYLAEADVVFQLGKQFCLMLEGAHVEANLASQLVKNLFFVGRALLPLFQAEVRQAAAPEPASHMEEDSESEDEEGRDGEDEDAEGEDGSANGHAAAAAAAAPKRSGLLWTFKQLTFIARQEAVNTPAQTGRRECVFKWYAAMVQHMSSTPELLPRVLLTMVRGLYRTDECPKSPEGIKALAQDVGQLVKGVVGSEAYLTAQSKAEQEAVQARSSRKRKVAMDAITQPALVCLKRRRR